MRGAALSTAIIGRQNNPKDYEIVNSRGELLDQT